MGMKPKVVKPSSKATVVVFDEKKYGLNRLKSLDGRGFKRREEESDNEVDVPVAKPLSNDPDE